VAFPERVVVRSVGLAMRFVDAEIGNQQGSGFGLHRAAAVGIRGELAGGDIIDDGVVDRPLLQHGGVRGGKHHGHVAKTDDLERKADGRFGGPLRDDKTAKIGRTNGPTSNGGSCKLSGVRHGVSTQPRPCANYRFRVLDVRTAARVKHGRRIRAAAQTTQGEVSRSSDVESGGDYGKDLLRLHREKRRIRARPGLGNYRPHSGESDKWFEFRAPPLNWLRS
jgi:hypothetical protein